MSDTIKLMVKLPNQEETLQEIENRGLTVIIPQSGINVRAPELVEISIETTLGTIPTLNEESWKHISTGPIFKKCWEIVWGDELEIPRTHQELISSSRQVRHVAGLIIQVFENVHILNKGVHIAYPEDSLHPSQERKMMECINFLCPDGLKKDRYGKQEISPTEGHP